MSECFLLLFVSLFSATTLVMDLTNSSSEGEDVGFVFALFLYVLTDAEEVSLPRLTSRDFLSNLSELERLKDFSAGILQVLALFASVEFEACFEENSLKRDKRAVDGRMGFPVSCFSSVSLGRSPLVPKWEEDASVVSTDTASVAAAVFC